MKKSALFLLLSICFFLLSACSLRSDAADLYKQESPLLVEINVPESLSTDEPVLLEAILRQNEERIEQADFVHFEIWKQDGTLFYPMEEAAGAGDGVYQMVWQADSDGLYYLKVHAGNNGSLVSPQHQFIVGELSDSELDRLKQGPAPGEGNMDNHH